jgi:hypothetical protein
VAIIIIYAVAVAFPAFSDLSKSGFQSAFAYSAWGVPLVLISGAIAFSGVVFYKWGHHTTIAKICLNASAIILFFGALIIELVVFGSYFTKTTSISVTQCTESFQLTQLGDFPIFTICLFTGYFPVAGVSFASLAFATFIIFYWLLPFAFLFAFVYGMFESTMSSMFSGNTGKSVTSVLTFIVAMYGARQMIGSFLIDFLAYGSWGLVGIFIPLFLAAALKRIFDSFMPLKIEEETLWDTIGVDTWARIKELEEDLKKTQEAKLALAEKGQSLDNIYKKADQEIAELNVLIPQAKGKAKSYLLGLKAGWEAVKKKPS